MHRRSLLRTATAAGIAVPGPRRYDTASTRDVATTHGPYGPLKTADDNGVALPDGFTSRVVARSMNRVGGGRWHAAPDDGACFADGDGWIYVSNSELPLVGGTSAIRFDSDGDIKEVYPILTGSNLNCSGVVTPWNTWLSCEEIFLGKVYETDPFGDQPALARTAMGRFAHEAVACDTDRGVFYLTEDESDGCLYRFRPGTWGDLSSGRLDVLCRAGADEVVWEEVPDPQPGPLDRQTRDQIDTAVRFSGSAGCQYIDGFCYFATTGDDTVWGYDAQSQTLRPVRATGPEDIVGGLSGDIYAAQDGGAMEITVTTPEGEVAPVIRLDGHDDSEITGPAFSPDGSRLYFSSQRGTSGDSAGSGGITYEVTGPFRTGANG